jgi:hypothetical protein
MTASSTHVKNGAAGWDITASVKADKEEKIARVQILVNGWSQYDQSFVPPIDNWQDQLNRQGDYPGDNTVQVIATSDKGEDTASYDSWS